MASQSATYCFTCARAVSEPHQIHRLEDGSACPGCVERLLEGLPALLPGAKTSEFAPEAEFDGAPEGFHGGGYPQGESPGFEPPPDCA